MTCVCCEHFDVSGRWCRELEQSVPSHVLIEKATFCYGEKYVLAQCLTREEESKNVGAKKKFTISYSELNYGSATIEAESKEVAEALAMAIYNVGNVHWHSSEVSDILVEEDE